ncbi:MAG TPA: hypothetical protein VIA98_07055 [Allosphingosinicella sp.]|jgi:hypothetical protein
MQSAILEPSDILTATGTPSERFISLSKKADQNFALLMSRINPDEDMLKYQYMTQLHAIATALGIPGLSGVDTPPIAESRWKQFVASVYTARTNAALASSKAVVEADRPVELSSSADSRIRSAISRLRDLINDSDVGGKKKARLLRRLNELEDEVNRDSVTITKALQTMAAIATIFGGTATGLAKAPEAITTIYEVVQLLGEQQETVEGLQLPAPPKLLAPPKEDADVVEEYS